MRDLITREEIKQVFAKKIKPKIAGLEVERSATIKKLFMYCGSAAVILLFICFYFFERAIPVSLGISGMIVGLIFKVITMKFVAQYKSEVIKEVFSALIPGCSYKPEGSIKEQTFLNSRLLNEGYDVFEGEDLVRGKLGDLGIEFSEITVSEKVRTKNGGSRKVTRYQGLFFAFTLPKDLRQNTLILEDSAEKSLGRGVGRFFQKVSAQKGYELVQVESIEFEKHYVVYSSDQITSRVLLKPMVLDNLINFKKKNRQLVDVSIRGKMLYLCIKTSKNHFEPNLFGPLVNLRDITEIYDLVMLVRDIYQDLELDQAA